MSDIAGSCGCKAVCFEVKLKTPDFVVCHCSMCRKQNGGPQMAVQAEALPNFSVDEALRWYKSSGVGERGFCSACGTNLFWRAAENPEEVFMISIGALDDAESLQIGAHIFIDGKPAYYDFKDDCPRLTEAEFLAQFEESA